MQGGGNMTDNSSEHTNTQHNDNLDLFNAEFTGDADTPPHRRRNTMLAVIAALLAIAGLLAATIIPIVNASHRRQQEEHATALAECESAQREFGTLNTTYTTTLSNASKLAQGDGKTISEEHATALANKIEHIDDTHTVSTLTTSSCETSQSTSDLNELARRFGAASTSMVNRMRDVQTDADTLRRLVEGARNSDRRGELHKQLTVAKAAYERSARRAAARSPCSPNARTRLSQR